MAKQSKAKNSAKPTAKSEVVAKPVTTQKKANSAKPKGPVPNYAKKVQPVASSFLDFFKKFEEKQTALSLNLFTGQLGKYAVQVGEKKMVVQSFKNEKGVQFECLETDFGFSTHVFLGEKLVKIFSKENFIPNFKLPLDVQDQQKALHNFLRAAYEETAEFKEKLAAKQALLVTDTYKVKPLFTLVPKASQVHNKWAGFAREEKTCSNIRDLVLGGIEKVYRFADESGKYAVMSCTSEVRPIIGKIIRIELKYLEVGHYLDGKCSLGIMVELHKLNRESLGRPHGQYEQQQRNQGVLHAWLRRVASAAGIKAKTVREAEKYGEQKRKAA